MNSIHLTSIDLNLLTVFDALMTERNATRAAERIGLTQPAVSHALQRLRTVFDDALFIRSPKGMEPTPFAHHMAAPVRAMLEQVESLLRHDRNFVSASSNRSYAVGMSDYALAVLLPRLLKRLTTEAPNVRLTVKNTGHDTGHAMLNDGAVELIAGNFPAASGHLRSSLLFRENFVCAGRMGHPGFKGRITLKKYLGFNHLQVSTAGNPHGYVDAILDRMHAGRNVVVTVGHFLAVPLLLQNTDLIATEPRRLFDAAGSGAQLACTSPPFPIPDFQVTMDWHARHDADPGHVWLRTILEAIAVEPMAAHLPSSH